MDTEKELKIYSPFDYDGYCFFKNDAELVKWKVEYLLQRPEYS